MPPPLAGPEAALVGSPEFRLFCLALRRPQQSEDSAAMRQLLAAGPDWRRLLAGARRHRVAAPLLAGLQACGSPDVPAEVTAALRRDAAAAAQRSLAQAAELARLARLFDEAGIRVLALKGVALSLLLYGDVAGRDPRDIDLLVDPRQFAEAESALRGAGYCRDGPTLSPRQAEAYRRWVKDAGYVHAANGIRVELHHRLNDNIALLPCDFAGLWRDREEVAVAGAVVATLPRRFLALYLGLHGAVHCWEELRWLVDLAAALAAPGAVDEALAAAAEAGILPPLRHALLLAHDWLGVAIGGPQLAAARADRRVIWRHRILRRFYTASGWDRTPPRGSVAGFLRGAVWLRLYNYALRCDWRFWRQQGRREFVTPADWQAVPLPDPLFWLFPLLRPVGWLVRRVRR